MANTRSAKKAQRVALRRRVHNVRRKGAMKMAVKQMDRFVGGKNSGDAEGQLKVLYQAVDKATKNGTIHRNTAARMKSRAARQLRALAA
ncbi:30S ribosomal protein S20 [Candidatus Kaiserbacteria bacterium RIFCSPLOWO2_12_FULL_53_8]|uniref:Small ribosomal subunit protein bS20 n=2 Tax=Candidatus Kaiseribacteriota TaxID=1752734 RepID=A0A1F6CTF6_9BACT|nr:MAG: 30S ribosomal protein S20 [Candidatus Kaiserbacteria bacterium RIFCSPHIGHO2_01_FULL_53_29]OGG91048.1 MAG: 30S ribosomal protein S20 [Candidatus Kaiserbacteria bacterium RIFCSPLOWO2_12_FULL_53_8]